jgi:RNA polymerase sigma factor (sigma-70 family)
MAPAIHRAPRARSKRETHASFHAQADLVGGKEKIFTPFHERVSARARDPFHEQKKRGAKGARKPTTPLRWFLISGGLPVISHPRCTTHPTHRAREAVSVSPKPPSHNPHPPNVTPTTPTQRGDTVNTDWLATRFEQNRPHLKAVAYRMLGSTAEAEDAVQEAWLKLNRSDTSTVDNLGGWLTTVVSRVCLDMLRSRESKREEVLEAVPDHEGGRQPENEAVLADSVGLALLTVLETLAPPERLAFVLHDLFAMPFDEIAAIVDRSPAATRQLASRARRRVHGATPEPDRHKQREVVKAFLAASRSGDFEALLNLLDPDVVLRADATAVGFSAKAVVRGAHAVAETFKGRAQAARLALVDGIAGAVWAPGGTPKVVFSFTVADGRIREIELLADREFLASADLEMLR